MTFELTSPACLLLGLVQRAGQPCELGITLHYPPIQLVARPANTLTTSGARAELAYQQAQQFSIAHGLAGAEIEIELAIPAMMGLGSDAMLQLSVARSLATLHGLPNDDPRSLEAHAFAHGGLLLVGDNGTLIERREIRHGQETDDWVWVLVLPRVPAGTPETLEADRRAALQTAARHLSADSARANAELWAAVERNDIAAFGAALTQLVALNHAALAASSQPHTLTPDEQATLAVMQTHGSLHCGRALTGLGLYALVKGAGPSRTLRRAVTEHIGLFGGTVMASLCSNRGGQM